MKVVAITLLCVGIAITVAAFSLNLSHEYASAVHLAAAAVLVAAWLCWRQSKRRPDA